MGVQGQLWLLPQQSELQKIVSQPNVTRVHERHSSGEVGGGGRKTTQTFCLLIMLSLPPPRLSCTLTNKQAEQVVRHTSLTLALGYQRQKDHFQLEAGLAHGECFRPARMVLPGLLFQFCFCCYDKYHDKNKRTNPLQQKPRLQSNLRDATVGTGAETTEGRLPSSQHSLSQPP